MKKILFVLIFLVSSNVWAEWTSISKSDDGNDSSYIDFKTVKKVGQTVQFWGLTDKKKARLLEGKSYFSLKQFMEINCSNNTFKSLHLIFTDANMAGGQVIYAGEGANKSEPISPGDLVSVQQEILCK